MDFLLPREPLDSVHFTSEWKSTHRDLKLTRCRLCITVSPEPLSFFISHCAINRWDYFPLHNVHASLMFVCKLWFVFYKMVKECSHFRTLSLSFDVQAKIKCMSKESTFTTNVLSGTIPKVSWTQSGLHACNTMYSHTTFHSKNTWIKLNVLT